MNFSIFRKPQKHFWENTCWSLDACHYWLSLLFDLLCVYRFERHLHSIHKQTKEVSVVLVLSLSIQHTPLAPVCSQAQPIYRRYCLDMYSTGQLQVYKQVRATHMACKVTCKYLAWVHARHTSSQLLTCKSKLVSVKHTNSCMYSRVLAIKLASTHHRTCKY